MTKLLCQWLMGTCTVNSVDMPDGSSWPSGVMPLILVWYVPSDLVPVCVLLRRVRSCRCSSRNASTWRRANVLVCVSILVSFLHRFVTVVSNIVWIWLGSFRAYEVFLTSF